MLELAPQFRYPKPLGRLPFQRTASAVVWALSHRGWTVPGIQVAFATTGTGQLKTRYVRQIRTADALIELSSNGEVVRVVVPGRELLIWESGSSLQLNVYIGWDWPTDREVFISDSGKLPYRDFDPLLYLCYDGTCRCRRTNRAIFSGFSQGHSLAALYQTGNPSAYGASHRHDGRLSPLLELSGDNQIPLGLGGHIPARYDTQAVIEQMNGWLRHNVLRPIKRTPRVSAATDVFNRITPFPDDFGPIYCFASTNDVDRIKAGWRYPHGGRLAERYAKSSPSHSSLQWVGDCGNAYDSMYAASYGMLHFGVAKDGLSPETPIYELTRHHLPRSDDEGYVLGIMPSRADGVFVMDQGPYDALIGPGSPPGHYRIAERARGRTFVPVTEYPGGYRRPFVVVAREIDLDEVYFISGPWPRTNTLRPRRGLARLRAA